MKPRLSALNFRIHDRNESTTAGAAENLLDEYLVKLRRRSNLFALEAALSDILAGGVGFLFIILVFLEVQSLPITGAFCAIFAFFSFLRLFRVRSAWMKKEEAAVILDLELEAEERITTLLEYAGERNKPLLYRRLAAEVIANLKKRHPREIRPHRAPLSSFLAVIILSGLLFFPRAPVTFRMKAPGINPKSRAPATTAKKLPPPEMEKEEPDGAGIGGSGNRKTRLPREDISGGSAPLLDSFVNGENDGGEGEFTRGEPIQNEAGITPFSSAGQAAGPNRAADLTSDTGGENCGLPGLTASSPPPQNAGPGSLHPKKASPTSTPTVTPSPSPTTTPPASGKCCSSGRGSRNPKPREKESGEKSCRKNECAGKSSPGEKADSASAKPVPTASSGRRAGISAAPTPAGGNMAGHSSSPRSEKEECNGKPRAGTDERKTAEKEKMDCPGGKEEESVARAGTGSGGSGVGKPEIPEAAKGGKITLELGAAGGESIRVKPSLRNGGEGNKRGAGGTSRPAVGVDEDARLAGKQADDNALDAAAIPFEYKEIIRKILTKEN